MLETPDDSSPLLLSAFDRSAPTRVPALARALERFGYCRYWMSEHRSTPVSASPTILSAVAAAVTKTIRVGTAGIKLRYASPFKVAEDFRLLEALFPGRIDLGTISAREPEPSLDAILLDGRVREPNCYDAAFGELVELVRPALTGDRMRVDGTTPVTRGIPQVWACGLHADAAKMAAARGVGFAYHRYLARQTGASDGPEVADLYRLQFCANVYCRTPVVAVVCFGACAEKREEAHALWRSVVGGSVAGTPGKPGPDFLGTPTDCYAHLLAIFHEFKTRELVVHCVAPNVDSQIHQYELLSDAVRMNAYVTPDALT